MTHENLFVRNLHAFLAEKNGDSARKLLTPLHPADAASLIRQLSPDLAWKAMDLLSLEKQAEIFGYFDGEFQIEMAHSATRTRLAQIISMMNADERADLYNRFTAEEQEALLPALAQAEREDIRKLSSYDEGTVVSVMTSDYATLLPHLTAREAIERLRREAPETETILNAYVIDQDRRLIGVASLQDLVLAKPNALVEEIMEREPIHVRANEDRRTAAQMIARYDLFALPVINGDDKLAGIVTYDDAMDVAEEDATRVFHKTATVGKLAVNMSNASIKLLFQNRVFWLIAAAMRVRNPPRSWCAPWRQAKSSFAIGGVC